MFEVEIKIDGIHRKKMIYATSKTIKEIEVDIGLSPNYIAVKKKNKYANFNDEINTDTKIDFINSHSAEGLFIYQDTAIFILCCAFHKLFMGNKLVIEHSIGDGVYMENFSKTFSENDVQNLQIEMSKIVAEKLEIEEILLDPQKATEIFQKFNRKRVLKNIRFNKMKFVKCGEYYDYFLRKLAQNTSLISAIKLEYHSPGLILRFPKTNDLQINKNRTFPRKLFAAHQEHDKWLDILNMHYVSSLNDAINDYTAKKLIQVEEALHEKKIVNIANDISQKKDAKLILIAGPSSSGKTTFAKRLSIQLQVNGVIPKIIGMDDYFLPRKWTPKKKNGEYDFESIQALDLKLLNQNLMGLMNGEEVNIPKYDFLTGTRNDNYRKMQIGENEIVIMEGIHGLNDKLTYSIPFNQKIKIYVSALNNLNIDCHNRIATTDSRKFRRLVRDFKFRGHKPEITLNMWRSVRSGEDVNIFPFQENADYMFNSILTYELAVLKKYILPLLKSVSDESENYSEVQRLIEILGHFYNIQDDLVPSNSILREFIGGGIFEY